MVCQSCLTEPGDYEVVATVVDANYAGSGSATYTLGKGGQSISFPAVPNLTINGNPIVLLLNAVAFDSNGSETGSAYRIYIGERCCYH